MFFRPQSSSYGHLPPLRQVERAENHVNVLCLDGGGVRGLTSLLILRIILRNLKNASRLPQVPLPCDVFDMICGTSTGGLIALMLGRLRMSVEDAIKEYRDFCTAVFTTSRGQARYFGSSHYDASKLERWVINMVAKYDRSGTGQASLADPSGGNRFCRTFVLAATQANVDSHPKHFRSYSTKSHPADTCTIWEAARATTAAIPFFDPAKVGSPSVMYLDAKFSGSNNPSMYATKEVARAFPSRQIACFLSLGTGVPNAISPSGGPERVAKACMKLIDSCERTHDDVARDFGEKRVAVLGEPYFRFSVGRGLGELKMDEWNRESELTGITMGHMRDRSQVKMVEKCVEILVPRASEAEPSLV